MKEISTKLPTSTELLKRIEYLTDYRVGLYGDVILSVTREYHEMRVEHLTSQAAANQLAREEDDFLGNENGDFATRGGGRGKSKYFGGGKVSTKNYCYENLIEKT